MIIDQLFLCVLIVGITKNLLIMKNVIIANIQKQIVKQIIGLVKNVLIAVFLIITDNDRNMPSCGIRSSSAKLSNTEPHGAYLCVMWRYFLIVKLINLQICRNFQKIFKE